MLSRIRRPLSSPVTSARGPFAATMASKQAYTLSSFLVKPSELNAALKNNAPSRLSTSPRVIPLCASWFLPNDPQKRKGHDVFKQGHIPSARLAWLTGPAVTILTAHSFFDLDAVSDTSSPYPHMLPSASAFSTAMQRLGVRHDDQVVVYDTAELGIFSAPRVAWTLRVFGHPAVHILNNFKLYVEEGFPVEQGEQERFEETEYEASADGLGRVVGFEEMKTIAADHNKEGSEGVQILDARSAGRWAGTEAEPRPGLFSGHMPGSLSVPVPELLDPVTKAFLPADKLRAVFEGKGLNPSMPIVSSCGTGVTAAVVDAALAEAGLGSESDRRIYDGSWTEWAQRVKPTDNLIVKSG